MDQTPFFSIVISTRDRPELFQEALRSVTDQTFSDKELIVVVDGGADENLTQYSQIDSDNPGIAFYFQKHRDNGHGQSYAMNVGASYAKGKFLCFLDDDDHWTDPSYLQVLHDSIVATGKSVDVHYSHQKACFSDGSPQTESVWIEDLIPQVRATDANTDTTYFVDVDFLLSSGGFAHLNCSVFNRKFYNAIGGMDESIRYENDRDVFIRAVDSAQVILFSTRYMSLHNIPDVNEKSNMSTMASNIEKKLYQMRVYDKGIALGKKPEIVKFCRWAKNYEQKHLATILAKKGDFKSASHYAWESLIGGFNPGWLAYTLQISTRALFQSSNSSSTVAPESAQG